MGCLTLRLMLRAARYRWKLNKPEIAEMLTRLPVGGTAIDCGGHKGAYSYWMAMRVGPSGMVITVEPQPRMVEIMKAAFPSGWKRRMTIVQAAASDCLGESVLKVRPSSSHGATLDEFEQGAEFQSLPVRLVTIDQLVTDSKCSRVDFIKIDVEGHEISVVRGAMDTVARFKPALLVESEARAHDGTDQHLRTLDDLLRPHGYQGRFHDGSRWRPLCELDVHIHQHYGKGHYCNNVLFISEPNGARGEST